MTAVKTAKRHSVKDAHTVITKVKRYSFGDFHKLFREGRALCQLGNRQVES